MRLSRYFYILLLLAKVSSIYAAECTQLGVKDQDKKYQGIGIRSSGNYCIIENIRVNEVSQFVLSEGGFRYQPSTAIGIHAPNISIDFRQYSALSNSSSVKNQHGVVISEQHNTLLKNGTLRVIGKQAVGVVHRALSSKYIYLPSKVKYLKRDSCDARDWQCEDLSYLDGLEKTPLQYQDANITIDNMNIFATYRGVQLADNHNTIRNSTIEVDDNNAIYLMGQYPVIENNTIIIHSNKNNDTEAQKKYNIQIKDGAIKLRDAQGGIIRNNRIIYKGGLFGGKAPVAINLLDSKDVLIEGNTFEGFERLVRENGDTSFAENNNIFK